MIHPPPLKILHINDNYHTQGGVEQYLLSAGDLLEKHGHKNIILYCNDEPLTIRNSRWPAYLVEGNGEQIQAKIHAIVEAERPDVAYIHHTSSAEFIETVSRLVPTLAYIHAFQAVCPGLAKFFRRGDRVCDRSFGWACVPMHYLRRCSAARHPRTLYRLMVRTARLKQAYCSLPRIVVATPYIKSLLVQNGFDPSRISLLAPHFLPDDALLEFRSTENSRIVLFAGRLEIEKGFPYLLRALSQIQPPARLMVAGDGTLRPTYEQMVLESNVADRVQFVGWLAESEMRLAYQRCSLLVMTSIWPEPFGKVGIEALAHGRPVVGFDVGGISDWLHDGVNGFLVEPRDTHTLAARMEQLLRDDESRMAMGRAGQTMVAARYTASQHLTNLLSLFRSVKFGTTTTCNDC